MFHRGVKASKIDLLITEIDSVKPDRLKWGDPRLGVSASAFERVIKAGGSAHQVFAHPELIRERPHLIAYYRNIVTISKKGIGQILFPTEGYESGKRKKMLMSDARRLCQTFNKILSGVIDDLDEYSVELSRQAILAEIGTELQGTWANVVGSGAAKAVRRILREYIGAKNLGSKRTAGGFELKNGWRIQFASEPDVAFYDQNNLKQIAIEIKGSLDVAGAQTRYGEAKKSFAKQLRDNPRCHTVYLASCFTDSVIRQIQDDGQVREWFNLTSILYDAHEKGRFLNRLFHIVRTPTE